MRDNKPQAMALLFHSLQEACAIGNRSPVENADGVPKVKKL